MTKPTYDQLAERSKACMDACANIPTYQLYDVGGVPFDIAAALDSYRASNTSLAERVASLEAALKEIAKPIDSPAFGDPWDFYNDVRIYAAKAVGEEFVPQNPEFIAATPAPTVAPSDLHATIMNLECIPVCNQSQAEQSAFRRGHKQARHAAAELVAAATREQK